MKIIQNAIGVIRKQPVSSSIILDNNRDHIINLHNITNVKNIVIIELHKTFLRSMHTEVKNMIINSSFMVEYQQSPENMFP